METLFLKKQNGKTKTVYARRIDSFFTCTAHSGAKKAHDWMVDQVADLFRTTHKVKTQQVVKSRGQHCGDIQLEDYLTNEAVRCYWCWTSGFLTTEWGAVPTLLLTDT